MGLSTTLIPHCRKILCQTAKSQRTITYSDLAISLGQSSAQQNWNILLNPIAEEAKQTGHDLTLVVVYKSGPAKNLGRYFSNVKGGQSPQTTKLDPNDKIQVAKYSAELAAVWAQYKNAVC